MTGSGKRRGLADFLGKELKTPSAAPPPPAPEAPRLPKSQTSRVREKPLSPSVSEREVEVVVAPSLQEAVAAPEPPKSVTAEVPKSVSREAPKAVSARAEARTPEVTESVSPEGGPLYLRLTRKEVRFRDDQLEALDRLARRLVRTRKGGGERITENTLVRVAVDLLLERAETLAGGTEAELLRSLRRK